LAYSQIIPRMAGGVKARAQARPEGGRQGVKAWQTSWLTGTG
jgi:hypothetical protein